MSDQIDLEDAIARVAASLYTRERSVQSQHLNAAGQELPNPVPLSPPIGYVKPVSIADQIRQAIRQASFEAQMAGMETEEEANDFDVGEDTEPHSPWENDFEIDPALEAMIALRSQPPAPPAGAVPPAAAAANPAAATQTPAPAAPVPGETRRP